MPATNRDRAVVLGGSIAGLITARVLADFYASVTIVERDLLPTDHVHRRGVPHGRHVHGLIPRGRQLLDQMLPGLTDELVASGALVGDFGNNVRWYINGHQLSRVDAGLPAISASRPLIEGTIRDRIRALPNVSILDGHDIVGLRPSFDLSRITGVRVTGLHGQGSRFLPCDLVIDATGRGSRTPLWLTQLGYAQPPTDRVNIDVAYASRLFAAPPELFGDDVVITTTRYPGMPRGSVMQRLENGRVLMTLLGILGERPPADLDGFTAYAQSLPVPDTYEIVRASRPLDDGLRVDEHTIEIEEQCLAAELHQLSAPVVEVGLAANDERGVRWQLDADEHEPSDPPEPERQPGHRHGARRGGHTEIQQRPTGQPHRQAYDDLRRASWRDAVAHAVQEDDLDEVAAEGKPQRESRRGEEEREVVASQREGGADHDGDPQVSDQRAAQRLVESGMGHDVNSADSSASGSFRARRRKSSAVMEAG